MSNEHLPLEGGSNRFQCCGAIKVSVPNDPPIVVSVPPRGGEEGVVVEPLAVTENGTYTAPENVAYTPVSVTVPQTTIEPKSITENGTYTAPSGKAYTPISVNVPQTTVEPLSVTENGTYTAETNKAYSPVTVAVPQTTIESKSITENGTYTAPSGKAYTPITVSVPQTTIESKSITENGTYTAPSGKAYTPVTVNVPQITVESKSITSNGTYTAPSGRAYSPVTVNVPASTVIVTESLPPKDVNFYDYDGTIVYAYTAAEFAGLTAMPTNPTHTNLTAQGWNWTLSDAQAYVASYGKLEIGQMYVSSTGNTEIDISLTGSDLSPVLLYDIDGRVNIYWGDGTSTYDEGDDFGYTTHRINHTYSAPGKYTISMNTYSGTRLGFYGAGNSSIGGYAGILRDPNSDYDTRYSSSILAMRLGTAVITLTNYAFSWCTSLKAVPISAHVTTLGPYAFSYSNVVHVNVPSGITSALLTFQSAKSLRSVSLPKSVEAVDFYGSPIRVVTLPPSYTTVYWYYGPHFSGCMYLTSVTCMPSITKIRDDAFKTCYCLSEITIPSSVTSIGDYAFFYCFSLKRLTIPSGVTTIGAQSLSGLFSLQELHMLSTTPPTITSNTLFNTPASCTIYVPSASLSTYQSAQYWSNYASQMVGE